MQYRLMNEKTFFYSWQQEILGYTRRYNETAHKD
jgi:hypothetical protein